MATVVSARGPERPPARPSPRPDRYPSGENEFAAARDWRAGLGDTTIHGRAGRRPYLEGVLPLPLPPVPTPARERESLLRGETWQRWAGGVDAIVWKCAVRLSFVSSAGREDLIVAVRLRMLV